MWGGKENTSAYTQVYGSAGRRLPIELDGKTLLESTRDRASINVKINIEIEKRNAYGMNNENIRKLFRVRFYENVFRGGTYTSICAYNPNRKT